MTRALLQQALDALENHGGNYKLNFSECKALCVLIEALRAELAKPEQEPRQWVGLTRIEFLDELWAPYSDSLGAVPEHCAESLYEDIEAALREKNAAQPAQEPVAYYIPPQMDGFIPARVLLKRDPDVKWPQLPLYTATAAQPAQEPLFWYRPRSDGFYEGPIHNAQIEQVRKDSGAWVPLYVGIGGKA